MADYTALRAELEGRGFTFLPVETWAGTEAPLSGPAWGTAGEVTRSYVHWPGAGSLGDDVAAWMRQVHKSRDYAFMYSWVLRDREVWEGRGWCLRNAANSGGKVDGNANDWSQSLLVYRTTSEAASDSECEAASIITHHAGIGVTEPHHAVEWTACPGDGMTNQITAGLFDYDHWRTEPEPPPEPPPEPAPEPEPKDDDVTYLIFDQRDPFAVWSSDGVVKTWVDRGDSVPHIRGRNPEIVETDDNDVIASFGAVVGPIPTGFDKYGRLV